MHCPGCRTETRCKSSIAAGRTCSWDTERGANPQIAAVHIGVGLRQLLDRDASAARNLEAGVPRGHCMEAGTPCHRHPGSLLRCTPQQVDLPIQLTQLLLELMASTPQHAEPFSPWQMRPGLQQGELWNATCLSRNCSGRPWMLWPQQHHIFFQSDRYIL